LTKKKLFQTHCDYMDRKILFGSDNRIESSNNNNGGGSGGSFRKKSANKLNNNNNNSETLLDNRQILLDMLNKTNETPINRTDLINALKSTSRSDLSAVISSLLSQEVNQSTETLASIGNNNNSNSTNQVNNNEILTANSSVSSMRTDRQISSDEKSLNEQAVNTGSPFFFIYLSQL
jgi:hypothetical protein